MLLKGRKGQMGSREQRCMYLTVEGAVARYMHMKKEQGQEAGYGAE